MLRTLCLLVLLSLAVPAVSLADGPVPFYRVTDLGPLPGRHQSFTLSVNDNGTAVGKSDGPVRWIGPTPESLGTLPGALFVGAAHAINASGQITGWADNASRRHRAFIWDSSGGMRDLGTLAGDTESQGMGINDSGWVTGFSGDQGLDTAFVWDGTRMVSLGTLPGGTRSAGYSINNVGWVTGVSDSQAMIWDGTSMRGIGFLPGDTQSSGQDINSYGWVVGASGSSGVNHTAFIWNGTSMTPLEPLPGDNRSIGVSVNDAGWVVGESVGLGPITINGRAVLWVESQAYDLNALIVGPNPFTTLRGATAISNSGLIVGFGDMGGVDHGFVLTPVSPRPDIKANDQDGLVTLSPGAPLQVQLAFDAGQLDGVLEPSELYIGLVTPFFPFLFWLDPSLKFVPSFLPIAFFAGALPSFPAAPLLNLPNSSVLPPGSYVWFMMVDNDANGTLDATFVDWVQTLVP